MPDDIRDSRGPSAAKNRQIVAAARKLFLEHGYSATSMDAITKEAAVSKPTIYNHYDNKISLFIEVICDHCREIGERSGETEDIPPGTPPREFLVRCGKAFVDRLIDGETADLFRIVLAESKRYPELGEAFWESGPKCFCSVVAEKLSEFDRQGALKVPDPDAAARQFAGAIFGVIGLPGLLNLGDEVSAERCEAMLGGIVESFIAARVPH